MLLRSREISSFGGIDANLFALVDERRDLHDDSGFSLCGFGHAGCSCALQARFGFNNLEIHGLGQFNAYGFAVKEFNFDLKIGSQVVHRIAEDVSIEMNLLVILSVHETVVAAVCVKEFHVNLVNVNSVDGVGGTEAVLEHGSGAQIAQLRLNERAQIAWRAVLDAEDRVQVIIVLDTHARTELGRWNRHC